MSAMDNRVICPVCEEPVEAANQGIAMNSGEILHVDCIDDLGTWGGPGGDD